MFTEYEVVRLKRSKSGLPAGTRGTVVMVHEALPPAYEVEFVDRTGRTLALLTLTDADLEPGEGG
jgi:hypothetical protein